VHVPPEQEWVLVQRHRAHAATVGGSPPAPAVVTGVALRRRWQQRQIGRRLPLLEAMLYVGEEFLTVESL
jgi:hypothetical protein